LKIELDSLFDIFRYISAKDIFEAFYTKRLAKRVLLNHIGSQELENYVLQKLKAG
jgi:cullin-4